MTTKKIKPKEKRVISEKIYTIKIIDYDDGTQSMHRNSDGFNTMEILGVCDFISKDVYSCMRNDIKPDFIKRTAVK